MNPESFIEHDCGETLDNNDEEEIDDIEPDDNANNDEEDNGVSVNANGDNDKIIKSPNDTAFLLKRELKLKLKKDKNKLLNRRMKIPNKSNNANNIRCIIWDIETIQEPDEDGYRAHKPNLVVAYEIIINTVILKMLKHLWMLQSHMLKVKLVLMIIANA